MVLASGLLSSRVAVVTGASSGIGRAIALRLAALGATVCGVDREERGLADVVEQACAVGGSAFPFLVDLAAEGGIELLASSLHERFGRTDILVHSAGVIREGAIRQSTVQDFDRQYAVNVRAPYLLTKALLGMIAARRGDVVFINSSAGLAVQKAGIGQYAATKHALKALADSLRREVNADGVRVLSIYAGRTATPMQEALCVLGSKPYTPGTLLQPSDIAAVVASALMMSRTAEITDITVRPMKP